MKYTIRLLKRNLKDWKDQEQSDREYYKGEEKSSFAKKAFRVNGNRITELKAAIAILENQKP